MSSSQNLRIWVLLDLTVFLGCSILTFCNRLD